MVTNQDVINVFCPTLKLNERFKIDYQTYLLLNKPTIHQIRCRNNYQNQINIFNINYFSILNNKYFFLTKDDKDINTTEYNTFCFIHHINDRLFFLAFSDLQSICLIHNFNDKITNYQITSLNLGTMSLEIDSFVLLLTEPTAIQTLQNLEKFYNTQLVTSYQEILDLKNIAMKEE